MSTVASGIVLSLAVHLVGLGPALLLWRRPSLPARAVGTLAVGAAAVVSYAIFWIAFVVPKFFRHGSSLGLLLAGLVLTLLGRPRPPDAASGRGAGATVVAHGAAFLLTWVLPTMGLRAL